MKGLGCVVTLLACVGCGALGFALAHRPRESEKSRVVARVNDTPINQEELNLQLLLFRAQASEQVLALKLLEREAQKLGVKVKTENSSSEPLARAKAQEARTQSLLRAIIVHQAGEAGVQDVYETCKPELCLYDVSVLLFEKVGDQQQALAGLKQGRDFTETARAYSRDIASRKEGGRVGWVSLPELKSRYGPYLEEALSGLKDNQISKAVPAASGTMVIKVHARKESLEQLRESVERVLVEARTTAVLARLMRKAVITQ